MKKALRNIHLWLSAPLGLVIAVVCFTGAMLVFEQEIVSVTHRNLLFVDDASGRPLPLGELMARAGQSLPHGAKATGVSISSDPRRAYRVNLSEPRGAALVIDQYTGRVRGVYERPAFFRAMFGLHRWLMDSPRSRGDTSWGKVVVGVAVAMFVLALLSGVAVWWPRRGQSLRRALTVTARHGSHRLWHSLHCTGGMYAVMLLLAMSLTGLTWSFRWYNAAFYKLFGVENTGRGGHSPAKAEREGSRGYASWQAALDGAKTICPDFRQITVSHGTLKVSSARYGNTRATDTYTFCPSTGRLLEAKLYAEAARQSKIRGWIYSVHVGSFGGLPTRLLWFVAALLGALLPLTGYYLWYRRTRRRRPRGKG